LPAIRTITSNPDLQAFIDGLSGEEFVTIDTEFIRETTYWPHLCLVQLAGSNEAVLVDPLAPGIDLKPLNDLFQSEITCVFHAGRQDLEIFHNLFHSLPRHVADTQIMAMVCGHGDQVGYERLVEHLCDKKIDKSQRFTDWARRPLNDAQRRYALADVTHLREIYAKLHEELSHQKRWDWLLREHEKLIDLANYRHEPSNAWQRLRLRDSNEKHLPAIMALAEFREKKAQERNVPRNRVFKDEALLQIAMARPRSKEELYSLRSIKQQGLDGRLIEELIGILDSDLDSRQGPVLKKSPKGKKPETMISMLKLLLKIASEQHGVAARLLATSEEIDEFARGRPGPEPDDWRYELFWGMAEGFRSGELGLSWDSKKNDVRIFSPNLKQHLAQD
tara:strand:- start:4072 stop:5244 length:1173 start_codon:yes stop_codon:yes gene_type:complete